VWFRYDEHGAMGTLTELDPFLLEARNLHEESLRRCAGGTGCRRTNVTQEMPRPVETNDNHRPDAGLGREYEQIVGRE